MTTSATPPSGPTIARRVLAVLPGLGLALAIAACATGIGRILPVLGSAVPGVLLGVLVRLIFRPGRPATPGIELASHPVLQLSIVLLGTQLSVGEVARVGLTSLPVMLGTLALCLTAAWLFGRLLGVVGDLRTLIGVGTGVCGGSAIAAVSPVVGALSADIAYAISTIFLFNIAAVVTFPAIGHLLGMSQQAFGLFAGTAVNDTSSVVAAAAAYGPEAAHHAVVVKLVRSLMIIPICLGLAALVRRRQAAAEVAAGQAAGEARRTRSPRVLRLVPWFLVGFVLMAIANSVGLIPTALQQPLGSLALFMITVALSAIGLTTDIAALRRAGGRPLLLGALLWVTVTLSSLALQLLVG
ncbi:YeiH family protein [Microlunatus soli]|nr:putative sulfate exporter family transporter [Microlunatus soli]